MFQPDRIHPLARRSRPCSTTSGRCSAVAEVDRRGLAGLALSAHPLVARAASIRAAFAPLLRLRTAHPRLASGWRRHRPLHLGRRHRPLHLGRRRGPLHLGRRGRRGPLECTSRVDDARRRCAGRHVAAARLHGLHRFDCRVAAHRDPRRSATHQDGRRPGPPRRPHPAASVARVSESPGGSGLVRRPAAAGLTRRRHAARLTWRIVERRLPAEGRSGRTDRGRASDDSRRGAHRRCDGG